MKTKTALKLAIDCIYLERRKYSPGYQSFLRGYKDDWTERDRKKYEWFTQAINIIERMANDE